MRKILNMLRTVGAILFLLIAAGAAVLFATDRLNIEKVKGLFAGGPEIKTGAPAVQAATPGADEISRKIIEQSKALEERRENEPIVLSAHETILYALKNEVESRRAALDKDRSAFDAERAAFEKAKKEFETKVSNEGFKKNLETLQAMEPKDAAKTIYAWKDEEILRYFRQMKAAALKDIIAELNKYPARATEGQRGAELLNKLDEFTFDPGTTTVGN